MISKKSLLIICTIVILFFTFFLKTNSSKAITNTIAYTEEQKELLIRFGITAPLGIDGYDLDTIHALTFLDWGKENLSVPEGVEYIHVLKMRFVPIAEDVTGDMDELAYQQFLLDLPDLIDRNPGSVWIIGNEPDRKIHQDDLTPEKYAERFYEVATKIKGSDPTALVGFGSVVQPTPIRIRYLQRSLDRLAEIAEPSENPLDLIDIWTIHSFILNENPESFWGADIPPGFNCPGDCFDAYIVGDYNFSVTYSIDVFKERIHSFRSWQKLIGEEEKPLWITEYGSLFPDWEVEVCYEHQEDCDISRWHPYEEWPLRSDNIKFMIDTFDYLLNAVDIEVGLITDQHKLVQRWYWYSLNGYVKIYPVSEEKASYGGSLFDPDKNKSIRDQGLAYKKYLEILIGPKLYLPLVSK